MPTILLIDDEQAIREMLNAVLSASYECHTADRAEQAFEFLDYETYDLVITDISMPGLGGIEIIKRIKQLHPSTPVIVISGRADEYRESLMDMGVFTCFSKPFSLGELEDTVAELIATKRFQKPELPPRINTQSVNAETVGRNYPR